MTIFDQWNEIMVDGLMLPVRKGAPRAKQAEFPVTQWRTNLYTRTFIDQ